MAYPEVHVYDTNEIAILHYPVLRKISIKIPEKMQSSLSFVVTPGKLEI